VAPVISTHHTAVAGSNNHIHYSSRPSSSSSVDTPPLRDPSPSGGPGGSNISYAANQRLINQIKEDWGHLDTMMIAIEGMVAKTQKSLQSLKERVLIASSHPPIQHLYKQFEQEHEASVLQRIEQAVEETKMRANEERQKILLDANRQMRETLKECNIQSTSKENCWNCGRKATETCSGCNSARYCGTFCQHKDWDKHLKICTRASNGKISQDNI
jgi:runt-related transcription factor 1